MAVIKKNCVSVWCFGMKVHPTCIMGIFYISSSLCLSSVVLEAATSIKWHLEPCSFGLTFLKKPPIFLIAAFFEISVAAFFEIPANLELEIMFWSLSINCFLKALVGLLERCLWAPYFPWTASWRPGVIVFLCHLLRVMLEVVYN